jgi:hypothetical protein
MVLSPEAEATVCLLAEKATISDFLKFSTELRRDLQVFPSIPTQSIQCPIDVGSLKDGTPVFFASLADTVAMNYLKFN